MRMHRSQERHGSLMILTTVPLLKSCAADGISCRDAGEDGECCGRLRVHVFRIIFIHTERRHTNEFMSLR